MSRLVLVNVYFYHFSQSLFTLSWVFVYKFRAIITYWKYNHPPKLQGSFVTDNRHWFHSPLSVDCSSHDTSTKRRSRKCDTSVNALGALVTAFRPWLACNQQSTNWLLALTLSCLRGKLLSLSSPVDYYMLLWFPQQQQQGHFFLSVCQLRKVYISPPPTSSEPLMAHDCQYGCASPLRFMCSSIVAFYWVSQCHLPLAELSFIPILLFRMSAL